MPDRGRFGPHKDLILGLIFRQTGWILRILMTVMLEVSETVNSSAQQRIITLNFSSEILLNF
ncbi:hypothetical protein C7N83_12710 [Neisseria iguanae]|uniref:Uncharacterized protein n=1 Tax=Neisseria iguanae TaxID=90242 RepID=A0A2P7TXA9_9NEIS|nr:hypothetical protein C7N83_12710 [Neisseria iguanae]